MAGGKYGTINSSYYLYTHNEYWSGSPYYFTRGSSLADGFVVDYSGDIDAYRVSNDYGARPVVSLSSKAKLSGSGTYSNPYTVS